MIYCQMENLKKNASEDDKKREEDRKQSEVYESHSKFMKCKVSTSGYFGVWIFISLLLLIVPWDVYLKFSLLWKTKFFFLFMLSFLVSKAPFCRPNWFKMNSLSKSFFACLYVRVHGKVHVRSHLLAKKCLI